MNKLLNYKSFFMILLAVIMTSIASCTTKEDQLMSPEEANRKIISAIMIKDSLCGTSHVITLPVYMKVRMDSVSLCVQHILSSECETWKSEPNLPASCSLLAFYR